VRADRPALVLGAERLGRVLDQVSPALRAERAQLVELARVAEHVTATTAFVRSVIAVSTRPDRGSACAGRRRRTPAVAPSKMKQFALEANEIGDVIASSPGPSPRCRRAGAGPAVPLETAATYGAPTRSADQLLEAVDRRPEREAPGAQHLDDELLLALVQQRPGERYLADAGAQASAGAGVA
jgi:hypothetical protein